MNVSLKLASLQSSALCTMHLVFPDASPPYTSTKVLPLQKEIPFKIFGSVVYGIVHVYSNNALKQRCMFIPLFNSTQNIPDCNISYEIQVLSNGSPVQFVSTSKKDLNQINLNLTQYVSKQYDLIRSLHPCTDIIRRKHSLFWDLEINGRADLKIPYVTLAMKGNNSLQNIKTKDIYVLRNFFRKELYEYFQDMGKYPTDFVRQSQKAYVEQDSTHAHAVMIQIANFFSSLIHKNIKYKTDYNATGKMDYVGIIQDQVNASFVADCEDQACAAYDWLRLFRTIFPSQLTEVSKPALTLPFHVSAWLTDSDVALFQGSVKPSRDTDQISHVWCAILSSRCPFVFVEPTANAAEYNKYKFLTHAWMYKDGNLKDLFFVNPHNHTYGLPIGDLVFEKNAYKVFYEWGQDMMDEKTKSDIQFVAHINTEPYSLTSKVLKK